MNQTLFELPKARRDGNPFSITAVCSAHPLVLRAAVLYSRDRNVPLLVEATCNQVNHEGGYTGMTPQDFVDLVTNIADKEQFDLSKLILGGDHLGPNPWRKLKSVEAMDQAEDMVAAYAAAGFQKFHLDASMRCADDPEMLDERVIAQRAARMTAVVEKITSAKELPAPAYVIGTEVPPPGGVAHELDSILPTDPSAALSTIRVHRAIFSEAGLDEAFKRVIALVVQPGVEFGDVNVYQYKPDRAAGLAAVLKQEPSFCFEAHSTDYQDAESLHQLACDGYGILKVGPWLTFAMREALYSLDKIAAELDPGYPDGALTSTMENLMISDPAYWHDHYFGSEAEQKLKRHFSYSDRVRYYWPHPEAAGAVERLMKVLSKRPIPETLVSQYLPHSWRRAMANPRDATELTIDAIQGVLANYPIPKTQMC